MEAPEVEGAQMTLLETAPAELQACIKQFWPQPQWENAAAISQIESGWNAYADNNTTSATVPCGARLSPINGVPVFAEHSVGYFQINVCNFPSWDWKRLWNAYQNCGTAHMLWDGAGQSWSPWFESATKLGLL